MAGLAVSCGTLLDGRIIYSQPVEGYRTGIEPILLAAAVPAHPGDRVVEAGTGAGAGLLALFARVDGVSGLGIERDPAMAGIAAGNFAANGCDAVLLTQDVTAWQADQPYDHAFANPPWHDRTGTQPGDPFRRQAKTAFPGLLESWCRALAAALRTRGTLSIILPASSLPEAVLALKAADCPEMTIMPLWKRSGAPAKLVILRGVRHGRGASVLLPGLCLHEADGGYTLAAEKVLRSGEALSMDPRDIPGGRP